ncbi:hypothetical protein [Treponema sp.]|uniref:hypothetical protein n=1 Tax=Treponema sp. TaxID=166 RepID=UPI0025F527E0|nr:hypothetical protein [Treponema sp.]MCR5218600.1 hypothetical protein [Treponema sp.]
MDEKFHFTMFPSYHEAAMTFSGGDMAVYGRLMYLVNVYGLSGALPEDIELTPIEKGFMQLITPNIDSSLKKQKILTANGSKGGRPPKKNQTENQENQNETKEKPTKNQNETKEKPTKNQKNILFFSDMDMDMDMDKEMDMDTDMDSACVCDDPKDSLSQNNNSEGESVPDYGALQRDIFQMVTEHNSKSPPEYKIPVSNSLVTFAQKEIRELLEVMRGESTDCIRGTVRNYIGVAESDTWKKMFSWGDFLKNVEQYKPEYFSGSRFLKSSSAVDHQSPAERFYAKMKNNPGFDVGLFTTHQKEWLAAGKPEGEAYLSLQDEWRHTNAS